MALELQEIIDSLYLFNLCDGASYQQRISNQMLHPYKERELIGSTAIGVSEELTDKLNSESTG